VRAYHRGNHIYIEVEDDGRGIDYDRVRSTAIEAGLVSADDAQNLDERALLEFLFHPGFSTAPRKTELAGRHGDGWKIRVSAPPEDGRANDAVLDLLAERVGLPRRALTIVSGHKARDKVVEMTGIDAEEAERKLS